MRTLFITAISIFSAHLMAHNATRFTCTADGQTLLFHIEKNSDQPLLFNFFDGKTIWLTHSMSVNQLHYQFDVFRPNSSASGASATNAIKTIQFALPSNREVNQRQSGGYYMPIITYYPAEFGLRLSAIREDGETQTINLKCTGW
jgi:hypothetical protein